MTVNNFLRNRTENLLDQESKHLENNMKVPAFSPTSFREAFGTGKLTNTQVLISETGRWFLWGEVVSKFWLGQTQANCFF